MEPLIYDRTQADVDYAIANKTLDKLKGAYNATDLNRVSEWVNYLSNILYGYGYGYKTTLYTKWAIQDDIRDPDWNNYIQGIRSIKLSFDSSQIEIPLSIRALAGTNGYIRANDIEKFLKETEENIPKIESSYRYTNDFMCGDE